MNQLSCCSTGHLQCCCICCKTQNSQKEKKTKKQGAPSRWAWAGGWESAFSRRTGLWEMGKREGPDPSWENGLSTYLYIFIQPLLFDLLSAAEQF